MDILTVGAKKGKDFQDLPDTLKLWVVDNRLLDVGLPLPLIFAPAVLLINFFGILVSTPVP